MPTRVLREPVIHFVIAGLALFALNQVLFEGPQGDVANTIVVDEAAVVQFVQHRENLAPDQALAQWQQLPDAVRSQLVQDFIQEEALYRKAKVFGLDESDYVIRRRLVQKMDFAAAGLAEAAFEFSEGALQNYYTIHQAEFEMPAQITFTHVYFDAQKSGPSTALNRASQQLRQLNAEGVAFSNAGQYGQRFPYHLNYVDRSGVLITDHFGPDFSEAVLRLPVNPDLWQGPVVSHHGAHLVLISAVTPKRVLAFSEVRQKIVTEMRLAEQRLRSLAFVDGLLAEFVVQIDPSLGVAQ